MLKNNKFGVSEEVYLQFKEALKNLVQELRCRQNLYAQTLGQYLYDLGNLLFSEDTDLISAEEKIVSLMAPLTEYQINRDISED
jgi:hypothetical protein